jgi:hypothetical protein
MKSLGIDIKLFNSYDTNIYTPSISKKVCVTDIDTHMHTQVHKTHTHTHIHFIFIICSSKSIQVKTVWIPKLSCGIRTYQQRQQHSA